MGIINTRRAGPSTHRLPVLGLLAVIAAAAGVLMGPASGALAKGGTAKPPKGAIAPFVTPTLADPAGPIGSPGAFSVDPTQIHGFDDTGFVQDATVSNAACPSVTNPDRYGGTVTVNNVRTLVPCNMVIQMPANTMTWADFVNGITVNGFPNSAPTSILHSVGSMPSLELRTVGNFVGSRRIAALMFASQQSSNTNTGVIKKIDYSTGNIEVSDGAGGTAVMQINDPNGRFGRAQSPDPRFSVDDANPTIHAATGYPMCVPRTDPATSDDPLCPQANRPKTSDPGGCRNFATAGVAPPVSGELSRPVAGQVYCSQYVMPAPGGASGPDSRQQAPFEVGDTITYSGTMIGSGAGSYISAHTIEANVGIYTQPGTQPSYLAIGEFGVGTADPNATAVTGVGQETQDRIFLEAETTDVKTPVDIYMMDVDPKTGAVRNRWVTPFEMTGENQTGNPSGGITTQNTGPQPQRARIRATKAPAGLLSQPTRTIRVVARSACSPQATADQPLLDACLNNATPVANGLTAGQYLAPVFEFIFPENVKPGDPIVPNDFWHLPFLRYGEGADTASPVGPSVGPLDPTPW